METICTPDDLVAWLTTAGLLPAGEASPAPAREELLDAARALREAIDAGVTAVTEGAPVPRAAVGAIDGALRRFVTPPALVVRDGVPVLAEAGRGADPVAAALGEMALDAARMLGTAERERVRVCASSTCSARFYDRSPAGRRRWCVMSACGNREKARRHRAARAVPRPPWESR